MDTIITLAWYDKKTEYLVDEKVITHLFSEEELKLLLGENDELIDCYPLTTKKQIEYVQKRLLMKFSEDYDYFIEISGDWELDLREATWIPAPASEFTDKPPMARKDAEKAFASNETKQILDALIRITLYDSDYCWIEKKCLQYLNNENVEFQREAIVCLGHLARIHGKINVDVVVPKLKELKMNPKLSEAVEDTLDDIESYLHVKRQS